MSSSARPSQNHFLIAARAQIGEGEDGEARLRRGSEGTGSRPRRFLETKEPFAVIDGLDGGAEPVTTAVNGLDESLRAGTFAQRLPRLVDADRQDTVSPTN